MWEGKSGRESGFEWYEKNTKNQFCMETLWFFARDGGGSDVFVHASAVAGEGFNRLADGVRVEFRVEQGSKGMAAADVRKLN